MILVPATKIVASAAVAVLASQCARNMIQTVRITRREVVHSTKNLLPPNVTDDSEIVSPPPCVVYLQLLKRNDLLEIFCQSEPPPDNKFLEGEWNGCLLDNNSKIMTLVSNVLTHALFGKGFHRWNGKTFDTSTNKGINRFIVKSPQDTPPAQPATGKRHPFSFGLHPSRVQPGTKSTQLNYAKCNSPLSPWYTMMDEVRVVPGVPNMLIGMGCVAWGGGFLNAAPFCLWKESNNKRKAAPAQQ